MTNYLKTASDKIIIETMDIQMENEQNLDILQKDIEMNGKMSTNDVNENYFSWHDSHNNEGEENDKETAMIMESLDYYKRSDQSSKSKTRKELIKTLQDLKGYLPPHKKIKGKSSILATLKYAVRSIKQIKANKEYYQLTMVNESCGLDILSCSMEDVKNITSEYTMKNADMFAVAVSLATGKILYISDQAACILHCKKDLFKNAKFVEFLAPQDVSVFYSSTIPYRLPSWSICNGVDSATQEFMEEKSFFCRFSAGKVNINENHYHPFRMTPYLIKIQDIEDQLCCVLLAEKVHSGYEAPRIPPNKRIFTTIHTPSCLFQEVDERAVPLLGYLPQDLIGTPVLLHLHPSDRALMLTIHKKILQYGGQPFDYSPIRFCTRNGEYVTLDTSWSSFINPWSRKITFIIGRHKVRTSPLNEDVFVPQHTEEKMQHPNIEEITEQIHKLLLQPIYNSGSSGYGSLGSNGSHEHLMSVASSSDSNGNNEDTQKIQKTNSSQNICKNGSVDRTHAFFNSRLKLENQKKSYREKPTDYHDHTNSTTQLFENDGIGTACQRSLVAKESTWGEQMTYSYQEINCLDNVIRYLESCCAVDTMQKMIHPTPYTDVALNTDIHREKINADTTKAFTERGQSKTHIGPAVLETSDTSNASALMDAHLTSLTFPGQPESVISFVSQCSYSSTIVHVGDKKTQPELEIIEDNLSGIKSTDNQTIFLQSNSSEENKGKVMFKKLGLTKDSLAIHTQKEEWSFLNKCKEIKRFHIFKCACNCYFQKKPKGYPEEHESLGLQDQSSTLFQSRCSSPLQLNLLQLEEMPKTLTNGSVAIEEKYETLTDGEIANKQLSSNDKRKASCSVNAPLELQNSDAFSLSIDLLDLLQEDTNSVTGSVSSASFALAAAESLDSGSSGCDISICGAGCSETNHVSKYIGSINSSENNPKTKCSQMEDVQYTKSVLQDPLWLLMAKADDTVMMTYQIPSRKLETVLKDDKLKLKQMQMFQPIFTEDQKRELLEVHPWIHKGELPQALANSLCVNCEENS
ncbi:period circadian protein homolog 2 isoform X1 [Pseudonaja textilis]|uniref:period circadian protein homolog 2 isoform X1 n=1 Tax=Pseudonaja textilis TaxID=8673 RepID=UPI000EA84A73|nr:period circadian protein homolog 2 isoform X1 [Pseudonaja textilis]